MRRFDSVFLSDLHLGWGRVSIEPLLAFLQTVETRELYLVGDIFEWMYRRSGWVGNAMKRFALSIDSLTRRGVNVTWISGNHDPRSIGMGDEAIWLNRWISKVRRCPYAIHQSRSGGKYLVVHGDLYDHMGVRKMSWKQFLAEHLYPAYLLIQNQIPNFNLSRWMRERRNMDVLMHHHAREFKGLMQQIAGLHGCHGVICGHIHVPEHCTSREIEYLNCGDWLEYRTYIGEFSEGPPGFQLLNGSWF